MSLGHGPKAQYEQKIEKLEEQRQFTKAPQRKDANGVSMTSMGGAQTERCSDTKIPTARFRDLI
jgi:SET domain-containing protein